MPTTEKLVTRQEIADLLDVDLRTVDRMRCDGRLPPPVRLGDGPKARVRWRRAEIERQLEAMRR